MLLSLFLVNQVDLNEVYQTFMTEQYNYITMWYADLGEIARAKFDFDVVGHYSRAEVFNLTVKDHPATPVTFMSASEKTEGSHK